MPPQSLICGISRRWSGAVNSKISKFGPWPQRSTQARVDLGPRVQTEVVLKPGSLGIPERSERVEVLAAEYVAEEGDRLIEVGDAERDVLGAAEARDRRRPSCERRRGVCEHGGVAFRPGLVLLGAPDAPAVVLAFEVVGVVADLTLDRWL